MHSSEISHHNELLHLPIFVAIEYAADELSLTPVVFNKSSGQQLLAHLAADLAAIDQGIAKTAITTSAALYDQAQLIRPGLPLFRVLSELLEASFSGQQFQPRMLAFGAHDGTLPQLELQPDANLPIGPFRLIPLQLSGPAELIKSLAEQLEHHFLEQGQLSAHSAQWLQEELEQKIAHIRFMTLNDVLAMLYLQLETIGLEAVWGWLEKMLQTPNFSQKLEVQNGPELSYTNGVVEFQFRSFDSWAKNQSNSPELQPQYIQWLNSYRQLTLLLQAHGLRVELLQTDDINTNLYCEDAGQREGLDSITMHLDPQLGLLAISVLTAGQHYNYYPLSQTGLKDLQALIQERYPKTYPIHKYNGLCIDADGRRLSTNL